jgi:hypothetical protein
MEQSPWQESIFRYTELLGFLDYFHSAVFLGAELLSITGPVTDINSFQGTQLSRCILPPSPVDANRSSFRNVVFVLPRTPNDGKS